MVIIINFTLKSNCIWVISREMRKSVVYVVTYGNDTAINFVVNNFII